MRLSDAELAEAARRPPVSEPVLCPEHEPGAWSRSCERCSVVAESRKLRVTPDQRCRPYQYGGARPQAVPHVR